MAGWLRLFKDYYIRLINLSNFAQGLSTLTNANIFFSSPAVPHLKPKCLVQPRSLNIVLMDNIYSALDVLVTLDGGLYMHEEYAV